MSQLTQVSSRPAVVELPEGCKKVKLTNNGPGTVFVGFGDQGVTGSSQDNRLDPGEMEFDVPEEATHMSLLGTSAGTVMVDAGEAKPKQKNADENAPSARKK